MKAKKGRYKLSPNEEAELIKAETEKRRKLRILQVREQSKRNAANVRQAVRQEKERQLKKLASDLQSKLEAEKDERVRHLEAQYENSLRTIGQGHSAAVVWDDRQDDRKLLEQEDNQRAQMRHDLALERLQAEKSYKEYEKNKHIIARKAALAAEQERAAMIASLPPPPPDPLSLLEVARKPVKMTDMDAFATTHYHIQEEYAVDRACGQEQEDAKDAALDEENRIKEKDAEVRRLRHERMEKARLRHNHALEKELLRLDYGKICLELSDMQRADRDRRQKVVASIPKQVFEPPHRRLEDKEDQQHMMEQEFEDMYMRDTNYLGDVSLALDPHPPPETPTTTDSLELSVMSDGTQLQEPTLPNIPPVLKDLTNTQTSAPPKQPEKVLKKLMNKIKGQRQQWMSRSMSDFPEHDLMGPKINGSILPQWEKSPEAELVNGRMSDVIEPAPSLSQYSFTETGDSPQVEDWETRKRLQHSPPEKLPRTQHPVSSQQRVSYTHSKPVSEKPQSPKEFIQVDRGGHDAGLTHTHQKQGVANEENALEAIIQQQRLIEEEKRQLEERLRQLQQQKTEIAADSVTPPVSMATPIFTTAYSEGYRPAPQVSGRVSYSGAPATQTPQYQHSAYPGAHSVPDSTTIPPVYQPLPSVYQPLRPDVTTGASTVSRPAESQSLPYYPVTSMPLQSYPVSNGVTSSLPYQPLSLSTGQRTVTQQSLLGTVPAVRGPSEAQTSLSASLPLSSWNGLPAPSAASQPDHIRRIKEYQQQLLTKHEHSKKVLMETRADIERRRQELLHKFPQLELPRMDRYGQSLSEMQMQPPPPVEDRLHANGEFMTGQMSTNAPVQNGVPKFSVDNVPTSVSHQNAVLPDSFNVGAVRTGAPVQNGGLPGSFNAGPVRTGAPVQNGGLPGSTTTAQAPSVSSILTRLASHPYYASRLTEPGVVPQGAASVAQKPTVLSAWDVPAADISMGIDATNFNGAPHKSKLDDVRKSLPFDGDESVQDSPLKVRTIDRAYIVSKSGPVTNTDHDDSEMETTTSTEQESPFLAQPRTGFMQESDLDSSLASITQEKSEVERRKEDLHRQLAEIQRQKDEVLEKHQVSQQRMQEQQDQLRAKLAMAAGGQTAQEEQLRAKLAMAVRGQALQPGLKGQAERQREEQAYQIDTVPPRLELMEGREIPQQPVHPPPSQKVFIMDDLLPHELSTIQEVDTPASTRLSGTLTSGRASLSSSGGSGSGSSSVHSRKSTELSQKSPAIPEEGPEEIRSGYIPRALDFSQPISTIPEESPVRVDKNGPFSDMGRIGVGQDSGFYTQQIDDALTRAREIDPGIMQRLQQQTNDVFANVRDLEESADSMDDRKAGTSGVFMALTPGSLSTESLSTTTNDDEQRPSFGSLSRVNVEVEAPAFQVTDITKMDKVTDSSFTKWNDGADNSSLSGRSWAEQLAAFGGNFTPLEAQNRSSAATNPDPSFKVVQSSGDTSNGTLLSDISQYPISVDDTTRNSIEKPSPTNVFDLPFTQKFPTQFPPAQNLGINYMSAQPLIPQSALMSEDKDDLSQCPLSDGSTTYQSMPDGRSPVDEGRKSPFGAGKEFSLIGENRKSPVFEGRKSPGAELLLDGERRKSPVFDGRKSPGAELFSGDKAMSLDLSQYSIASTNEDQPDYSVTLSTRSEKDYSSFPGIDQFPVTSASSLLTEKKDKHQPEFSMHSINDFSMFSPLKPNLESTTNTASLTETSPAEINITSQTQNPDGSGLFQRSVEILGADNSEVQHKSPGEMSDLSQYPLSPEDNGHQRMEPLEKLDKTSQSTNDSNFTEVTPVSSSATQSVQSDPAYMLGNLQLGKDLTIISQFGTDSSLSQYTLHTDSMDPSLSQLSASTDTDFDQPSNVEKKFASLDQIIQESRDLIARHKQVIEKNKNLEVENSFSRETIPDVSFPQHTETASAQTVGLASALTEGMIERREDRVDSPSLWKVQKQLVFDSSAQKSVLDSQFGPSSQFTGDVSEQSKDRSSPLLDFSQAQESGITDEPDLTMMTLGSDGSILVEENKAEEELSGSGSSNSLLSFEEHEESVESTEVSEDFISSSLSQDPISTTADEDSSTRHSRPDLGPDLQEAFRKRKQNFIDASERRLAAVKEKAKSLQSQSEEENLFRAVPVVVGGPTLSMSLKTGASAKQPPPTLPKPTSRPAREPYESQPTRPSHDQGLNPSSSQGSLNRALQPRKAGSSVVSQGKPSQVKNVRGTAMSAASQAHKSYVSAQAHKLGGAPGTVAPSAAKKTSERIGSGIVPSSGQRSGADLAQVGGANGHAKTLASWKKSRSLKPAPPLNSAPKQLPSSAIQVLPSAPPAIKTAEDRKREEREVYERNMRLCSRLDEVVDKKTQEEREKQYAANREKGKDYQKKLQDNLKKQQQKKDPK